MVTHLGPPQFYPQMYDFAENNFSQWRCAVHSQDVRRSQTEAADLLLEKQGFPWTSGLLLQTEFRIVVNNANRLFIRQRFIHASIFL